MPRKARILEDRCVYHVTNRCQPGQEAFRRSHDYLAFLDMLLVAKKRYNIELYAFCLLADHFHLLVRPTEGANLSHCMQWLQTSFARRFNDYYNAEGSLWQGRYQSCLVQQDRHLLTVMSYIEGHPLRAGLANSAQDYVWSSHRENHWGNLRRKLDDPPVPLAKNWSAAVNAPLGDGTLQRLTLCTRRQIPYGSPEWQQRMCRNLGIEASLRPRGRPPREQCGVALLSLILSCLLWLPPQPAMATVFGDWHFLKASGAEQAAVLRDPSGSLQLLRVGDVLADNARVTAIGQDRVLLEQLSENGRVTRVFEVKK